MDVVGLLAVAFVAGMLGGMVGVGGGVLFVPGLVVLMDLSQLEAEATSLVAVVAVGAVGAWRQHGYGNLRLRDALAIGLLSPDRRRDRRGRRERDARAHARAALRRAQPVLRRRARAQGTSRPRAAIPRSISSMTVSITLTRA